MDSGGWKNASLTASISDMPAIVSDLSTLLNHSSLPSTDAVNVRAAYVQDRDKKRVLELRLSLEAMPYDPNKVEYKTEGRDGRSRSINIQRPEGKVIVRIEEKTYLLCSD